MSVQRQGWERMEMVMDKERGRILVNGFSSDYSWETGLLLPLQMGTLCKIQRCFTATHAPQLLLPRGQYWASVYFCTCAIWNIGVVSSRLQKEMHMQLFAKFWWGFGDGLDMKSIIFKSKFPSSFTFLWPWCGHSRWCGKGTQKHRGTCVFSVQCHCTWRIL